MTKILRRLGTFTMVVAAAAFLARRRQQPPHVRTQTSATDPTDQQLADAGATETATTKPGFPGRRPPSGGLIALVVPAAGVIAGTLVVLAHRVAYEHVGVMSTEVSVDQGEAMARALTLLLPLAGALTIGIATQALVNQALFAWLNKRPLDDVHVFFAAAWSLLVLLAAAATPASLQLPAFLLLAAIPMGALVVARTEAVAATPWKEAIVASARWGSVVSAGLAVCVATAMWAWGAPSVGRHIARTGSPGAGWGVLFDIQTTKVDVRLVEPDPELKTASGSGAVFLGANAGIVLVLVPTCAPGGDGTVERVPADRLRELARREKALCDDTKRS